MTLLQVTDLSRDFGGVRAVDGISFDLRAGEMLALIGPNGAGKSTTFNMIGGQLRPSSGQVRLDGRAITGLPPRAIARLGVGRTFQVAATFAAMTVLENVQMALLAHDRKVFHAWRPARAARRDDALALLEQVGMQAQATRPCSELAYGDVKRVELAVALAGRPRLLLMDEPTAGMAPAERHALMALTQRLARERGMAVLFTEHSMDVVFTHADRLLVLARGKLIAQGTPAQVRADAQVQAVYFGSGATFTDGALEARPVHHDAATLLRVRDLHGGYGAARILFGIDLDVRRGEVVALMGRNGAGKSTTIKTLMGLLPATQGRIDFIGRDITGRPAHRIARLGLGYVPEERRIFTDLTVAENLALARQAPRAWPDGTPGPSWNAEQLYVQFPHLASLRDRAGGQMSGGEQQMLTVARTLMGNPYLVLLDEPSEGVAPVVVEQMAAMILALKQQGASILLSEQNLHFAALVADRAYVLDQGRICYQGTMQDLVADGDARRTWLGI
ncbi:MULTISPECIES: ATP-binding cassette domain-containing protein [unclassified Achromobacter]|uniref:ATP-binding cassette domain-containing protein n=1 Tax=unclassified Achromobacter TaxID=2626865 RepID=UPI000B519C8B|nr:MULTISPECIES: ATP-binding cassette domain-containing protein [unclassified Achromobacter]OWT74561.1 branched-chain amino acid ABC transporter ATP-binding protein [Achromobacter sp. HZ34]OWT79028.1 branched-chain amino acid ABC transporter ATP-binding protein [Achromobacter sp. HZ28]